MKGVYAQAVDRFHEGDFRRAFELFSQVYQEYPDDSIASHLGMCAFQLGHYPEALELLRENAFNHAQPYRVEVVCRILEQLGRHRELREYLAAAGHESPPLQQMWRPQTEQERGRDHPFYAELKAKLTRGDLACHTYNELIGTRKIDLQPFVLEGATAAPLQPALDFFRRELGRACPVFVVHEPRPLEALEMGPGGPMNLVGRARRLVGKLPHRWKAVVFQNSPDCAFSGGAARYAGRLTWIELGHHHGHRELVTAHELAHLLLDLPDLAPGVDDPLSLLGEWDGPLELTFLGMAMKASVLTPRSAQSLVTRGYRLQRKGEHGKARQLYERAWRQDPWHRALGLQYLSLLKRAKRARGAAEVAEALRSRYPSVEMHLHCADFLDEKIYPRSPEELSESDCALVARWHLTHRRPRAAKPYLDRLPAKRPDLLASQAHMHAQLWRFRKAEALYQEALRQAPFHAGIRRLYGVCLCLLLDTRRAREQFRQSRELEGGPRRVPSEQFHLAWAEQRWESALRACEEALDKNDFSAFYWFKRGVLEHRLGRPCVDSLRRARALSPSLMHSAYLAWAEGDQEKALERARRAERIYENRPLAQELLELLEPGRGWRESLFKAVPTYRTILW